MTAYDNSIADVLRTAIHDAQDLVRGEIALAKAEMREEVRRVGAGMVALAAAAIAGVIAVVLLLTAVARAISEGLAWPVWTGFALVGAVVAIGALMLAYMGRQRLKGERHMGLTVDTLKENMQWMRARKP
jgi:multidrug transporter EmrE-like cation transporter